MTYNIHYSLTQPDFTATRVKNLEVLVIFRQKRIHAPFIAMLLDMLLVNDHVLKCYFWWL